MSDHVLAILGVAIGVFGAIAGAALAVFFYFRSKIRVDPRYMLGHEVLLGGTGGAMKDVQLSFEGNRVSHLNRCVLTLWNAGKATLGSDLLSAFDPLQVSLPSGASVLGVDVIRSNRASNQVRAYPNDSKTSVLLGFDFLDQNDGAVIEVVYGGETEEAPILTGAVKGVKAGFATPEGMRYELQQGDGREARDGVLRGSKASVWPAGVLVVLTLFTVGAFGPSHPASIVLFTILGEFVAIFVVAGVFGFYIRQKVRVPSNFVEFGPLGPVGSPSGD